MPLQANVREAASPRMIAPVVVLLASVAACSAMRPADAGTPTICRPGNADAWIGRAASASIVEQARHASGSSTVRVVKPDESTSRNDPRIDRLNLYLDNRALITRTRCG
ncbi:I78 family peptidase inhibitor [Cognatilysobacter lacus]|uniref:Peptidase inhibitor I78 family protein n=1 Tax=Cognatilysobacter lacus TaxID=1643323 RepID=A0A5D8YYV7_9GAMM|nr:I78 family peptidase inhibitor [Lysobacter lacus]TZF87661.1 hypothetical protein FW784_10910 [Lysobacter lacus]